MRIRSEKIGTNISSLILIVIILQSLLFNAQACCLVTTNHPTPSSGAQPTILYLLESARMQRLFGLYDLNDDLKVYGDLKLLLGEMDARSSVAIVPWQDVVLALREKRDIVIIGTVEDKYPYALFSPENPKSVRVAISRGIVAVGEMSAAHLAAQDLQLAYGSPGKPIVVEDYKGLTVAATKGRSSALVPIDGLESFKDLHWTNVAYLGDLGLRFPATVIITTRTWAKQDPGTMKKFLLLVQSAMKPAFLRSDALVKHALDLRIFPNEAELRTVVEGRLIIGGARPPIPDKQIIATTLAREWMWYPYLREISVDQLVNDTFAPK